MSAVPDGDRPVDDLEAAADQAVAACGGDAREAVKALIVANNFLEEQLQEMRSAISTGYARGRFNLSRDPKDQSDV